MDCMPEISIMRDLTRRAHSLTKLFACPRLLPPTKPQQISTTTISDLPKEMIVSILANLEIPDLIRAGSICSSWHSAYVQICELGLCKESQAPYLLYTTEFEPNYKEDIVLYSLAERKSYILSLPDPRLMRSSHVLSTIGMSLDPPTLHLLNPITGDQITRPSVTTIEQFEAVYDDSGVICRYMLSFFTGKTVNERPKAIFLSCEELQDTCFRKAFLSGDPSTGNYFVVLIHKPFSQLSFARGGDDKWTWLPPYFYFSDCIFKDGLLYALICSGGIHKIIIDRPMDVYYDDIYLVQDRFGDLLQVWTNGEPPVGHLEPHQDDEGPLHEDEEPLHEDEEPLFEHEDQLYGDEEPLQKDDAPRYKVYKVDLAAKKLVDGTSLGEDLLFLGCNQSLCLSTEEHPQLKANHVYFALTQEKGSVVGVLNLENRIIEDVLPRQLWSDWRPGLAWTVLNPRKMISASYDN
uniref:F-box domain-containing protein n=1 Tax=Leersia perrieri TaxID=77586 RepID=A0A0D9XTG0_9ORYZ